MRITSHGTIQRRAECLHCGKELWLSKSKVEGGRGKYCSRACKVAYNTFEVECSYCKKIIQKHGHLIGRSENYFCNKTCKGRWASENLTGEHGYNWRGGTWNNRVQYLAHTSYRTWRANLLKNAFCILCGCEGNLELHHIESKVLNPGRIKDESNVVPMCAREHDILHSKSRKGGELREHLNDILSHGDPQPSRSNVLIFVGRKVQRLTGEDTQTDKPDTSAAPERDDIVRTYSERVRS